MTVSNPFLGQGPHLRRRAAGVLLPPDDERRDALGRLGTARDRAPQNGSNAVARAIQNGSNVPSNAIQNGSGDGSAR